jgi:hypothetical protein
MLKSVLSRPHASLSVQSTMRIAILYGRVSKGTPLIAAQQVLRHYQCSAPPHFTITTSLQSFYGPPNNVLSNICCDPAASQSSLVDLDLGLSPHGVVYIMACKPNEYVHRCAVLSSCFISLVATFASFILPASGSVCCTSMLCSVLNDSTYASCAAQQPPRPVCFSFCTAMDCFEQSYGRSLGHTRPSSMASVP